MESREEKRLAEAQDIVADDGQDEDAEDDADQAEVQPHVAVEDMAELVAQDALEFLAGEVMEAASGDGHHGIAGLVAGGEGVDSRLVVEHVDRRHRDAGGQGHLLDHVQ